MTEEKKMLTRRRDELLRRINELALAVSSLDERIANLDKYVQVRYVSQSYGSAYTYTYIDPSGSLKAGDLVIVDAGNRQSFAEVVALGRGNYTGPCKTIEKKVETVDL